MHLPNHYGLCRPIEHRAQVRPPNHILKPCRGSRHTTPGRGARGDRRWQRVSGAGRGHPPHHRSSGSPGSRSRPLAHGQGAGDGLPSEPRGGGGRDFLQNPVGGGGLWPTKKKAAGGEKAAGCHLPPY